MTKNKKRYSLAALGLAACLVAGATSAAPAQADQSARAGHRPASHHPDPSAMFARLDKDGNGKISQQEFVSAHEEMAKKFQQRRKDRPQRSQSDRPKVDFFAKLDKDGNGAITRAEWDEGKAKAKQARAERRDAKFKHARHERKEFAGPRGHRFHHKANRFNPAEVFKKFDTNSDGQLSKDEWDKAHERFRAPRR